MSIFLDAIRIEHESEHVLEHDLSTKKNFSTPKIYTAKGDLSKRWYVYFSFRDPVTKKLVRMKNIYGKANNYTTKADRLAILSSYRSNLLKLLKEGYSPFENEPPDKSEKDGNGENTVAEPPKEIIVQDGAADRSETQTKGMPLQEAFDFVLKLKRNQVKRRTLQDYGHKTKTFLKWLSEEYPNIVTVDQLTKKMVMEFLNHIVMKSTPRNRNNFRLALGTLLQTLENNELIKLNFIKSIAVLNSVPVRNKTFSLKVETDIFAYLEKEDPLLLLYIKFVAYNFLRPIEVSRLRIRDFNLNDSTITFQAKNSILKKKTVPQILLDELPDISQMNPDHLFFTPDKIGGVWATAETNRRNYFSKRFKEKVKKHFDLNEDYGLYSFRHTYITKIYRMLLKDSSPFEAKSRLMLITGHKSMSALEKYLRDIDAELAKDYSDLLK
ncbi:site-specific integrase [Zobellia amurskyensis]|uniref:Site-specific integrase n=1 Tax=Zobellia amurskyensis TaxID=248905 RepID=A0A7X2ZV50_9FLAO|nr:site-specific integrase [Zobellia amurskyensis]MUH36956.1 site-specific integrase [Zobellia amurskyensis]